MIDPATVCLFIPPGLKKFKLALFNRIGEHVKALGGTTIQGDYAAVPRLPDEIVPIVGVSPEFRETFWEWRRRGRDFIYWDRGYLRRVFATWLPNGDDLGVPGGYYRWHKNSFQMNRIDDVPDDRWKSLRLEASVKPWKKGGPRSHIVVADTGVEYWDVHADRNWTNRVIAEIRRHTGRRIVIRGKEAKVPLYEELAGAHCLVTHGSVAAVEAVVMGYPVFVDPHSAAALVGSTDFTAIERPVYPDRTKWLHSLAYNQWNENELVDGTLFRMLA